MVLGISQTSEKVPVEKIKLNSSVRGYDNSFSNVLEILVEMLFFPIAFLSLKTLRWCCTSSAVIGVRKKVFSLRFFKNS